MFFGPGVHVRRLEDVCDIDLPLRLQKQQRVNDSTVSLPSRNQVPVQDSARVLYRNIDTWLGNSVGTCEVYPSPYISVRRHRHIEDPSFCKDIGPDLKFAWNPLHAVTITLFPKVLKSFNFWALRNWAKLAQSASNVFCSECYHFLKFSGEAEVDHQDVRLTEGAIIHGTKARLLDGALL